MSTDPTKPPRCDAVLKNLPEERQVAIAEKLDDVGLKETLKWLREDGVTTSMGALSEFWSWWRLVQRYKQRESAIGTILETLRQKHPELTEEELFRYGQDTFSVMALQDEDPKDWARIQLVRQRQAQINIRTQAMKVLERRAKTAEEQLRLAERKFKRDSLELFQDWYGDQKVSEIMSSDAGRDARTEELGQRIFGEDWK